jgi:hypothetical protein
LVPLRSRSYGYGAARGVDRDVQVREFLLVGGLTPFLFLLSWLLRRTLGLDAAEYAVGFTMFYGAYLINDPHFAVTYRLFYEKLRLRAFSDVLPPRLRAGYWLVGALAPALLLVWAGVGLTSKSPAVLGALVQLMFLLVGWHYTKQGFGVMLVLSARRGTVYTARERLALLAHAYAGWGFAWANPADPGREVEEKGLVYQTWSHGVWLERGLGVVLALSSLWLALALARKWQRERTLPALVPLCAFLCSIWSWSIFSSADPLVRYAIPALHSLQYLYMVHVMKSAEARVLEAESGLSRSARMGLLVVTALALGVFLFHALPSALDGMLTPKASRLTDMGPTPYFAALYAVVNIHHYLMDAVIWRRDNPDTRYLHSARDASV